MPSAKGRKEGLMGFGMSDVGIATSKPERGPRLGGPQRRGAWASGPAACWPRCLRRIQMRGTHMSAVCTLAAQDIAEDKLVGEGPDHSWVCCQVGVEPRTASRLHEITSHGLWATRSTAHTGRCIRRHRLQHLAAGCLWWRPCRAVPGGRAPCQLPPLRRRPRPAHAAGQSSTAGPLSPSCS